MRVVRLFLPLAFVAAAAYAQNAAVTVNVDAAAKRLPISPNVYGLSFASSAQLADLNVPINRSGGNAATRYNWQANASNRANDWYFESIGEDSATPGEAADTFISNSKASGAQAMITVPIIGWVAKLGPNRAKLSSFSVAKYGAQQYTDYWMPDAGNGVLSNGQEITNNDPHDANMPVDASFQLGWFQHLVGKWGDAAHGGLRYYILDNEHSIWFSTHRDVTPTGATMDDVFSKMVAHAQAIKGVDPNAVVAGPEEWGWGGWFYSGYDQQYAAAHNWCCYPDRMAHGNMDYAPWLLDQFQRRAYLDGKRLLDVFTLHIYPQGGEYSDDTSTAMQQKRNRSTRSLWDPSYTDESWIGQPVFLIPRMHQWVDSYYPDTKIGITEYNWGAESHINGATTQADILGIFGREGLDLATRWTTPDAGTPVYNAIKMYRNYDGANSVFGDISVSAGGPNPDNVSSFAAVRSTDKALTIMLINKALTGNTPATINVANFATSGAAHRWQLTSTNTIDHLADVTPTGSSLSVTLPPQSITLLVWPGTTDVVAPSIALNAQTPAANGKLTFSGTASDDTGVTRVSYKITGATNATGNATGTTSWSSSIAFNTGTSRVTFYAYDAAGNWSKASTVVVQTTWLPQPTPPAKHRGAGH